MQFHCTLILEKNFRNHEFVGFDFEIKQGFDSNKLINNYVS